MQLTENSLRPQMATILPVGKIGIAEIQHFTVDEQAAKWMRLRQAVKGPMEMATAVGEYAKLLIRGDLVMSDTDMEWSECQEAVRKARGDVLVAGLGLGMVVHAMLTKPEVKTLTVLEIEPDVIALVGPSIRDPRVKLVQADACQWQPPKGTRWHTIWLDIWPDLCTDNVTEMKRLRSRYGCRLRKNGWIGCWSEDSF